MPLRSDTRELRITEQLDRWLEGESIHNQMEDVCCPDFSCCNSELLADKGTRELYVNAYKQDKIDVIDQYNMMFLLNFLSGVGTNSYVTSGKGFHPEKN